MPSGDQLEEIIQLARAILFPGYFGQSRVNIHTIKYQIGVNVERLYHLLCEQILAGLGFNPEAGLQSAMQPADADCTTERKGGNVRGTEVHLDFLAKSRFWQRK